MSGPGLSGAEVLAIAAFALDLVVAPASAGITALAILWRRLERRPGLPRWLVPIAALNLLLAGVQLVVIGSDLEWWLAALLVLQCLLAIAVTAWALRVVATPLPGPPPSGEGGGS